MKERAHPILPFFTVPFKIFKKKAEDKNDFQSAGKRNAFGWFWQPARDLPPRIYVADLRFTMPLNVAARPPRPSSPFPRRSA